MLIRLRPVDALVAWVLNLGVPLLAAVAWLVAVGVEPGWLIESALRLLAALLLLFWLRSRRDIGWGALRQLLSSPPRHVLIGAAVGLAWAVVVYSAVVAWQWIDRTPNLGDGTWNPWVATQSVVGPYAGYFIALVLIGPLVEEFVHRGVAFGALQSRFGITVAAVVSSVVFALGHEWVPFRFVDTFLSGLIYVWLTHRYRSLAPALAAHVVGNGAVFASGWAAYNIFGVPGRLPS